MFHDVWSRYVSLVAFVSLMAFSPNAMVENIAADGSEFDKLDSVVFLLRSLRGGPRNKCGRREHRPSEEAPCPPDGRQSDRYLVFNDGISADGSLGRAADMCRSLVNLRSFDI